MKYSQETKNAYGAVVLACFGSDRVRRDAALSYLAKMVGCDLSDEIRGVMKREESSLPGAYFEEQARDFVARSTDFRSAEAPDQFSVAILTERFHEAYRTGIEAAALHVEAHASVSECCAAHVGSQEAGALAACIRQLGPTVRL